MMMRSRLRLFMRTMDEIVLGTPILPVTLLLIALFSIAF